MVRPRFGLLDTGPVLTETNTGPTPALGAVRSINNTPRLRLLESFPLLPASQIAAAASISRLHVLRETYCIAAQLAILCTSRSHFDAPQSNLAVRYHWRVASSTTDPGANTCSNEISRRVDNVGYASLRVSCRCAPILIRAVLLSLAS